MTLIAILIALVLEGGLQRLRSGPYLDWLMQLVYWIGRRGGNGISGAFTVFLALSLPALLVGLMHLMLGGILGPLGFAFAVLVLAWSLGLQRLVHQVNDFLDMCERGDEEGARYAASALAGVAVHSGGDALEGDMLAAMLVQANERVFGVLFWFLLLGPVGAALYRLSDLLQDLVQDAPRDFDVAAGQFHWALSLLPARLAALAFAVAGNFTHAVDRWHAHADDWPDSNVGTLVASGTGALGRAGDEDPIRAGRGLLWRALTVWVTVVALFTLGGWMG
jgi:membrane protein required for beta-lactamase induction